MRLDEITTKFRLHPKLNPDNYKISKTLRDVEKWQAVILDASSSIDKDVGDWDSVGYVFISLKDDTLIPIARGDEHHKGTGVIHDLGINEYDYYPIFYGGDYIDEHTVEKLLIAAKKWRKWGGANLILEQGYSIKTNALTMDQFIKAGGVVNITEGKIAPLGQEIIDHLKTTAKAFQEIWKDDIPDQRKTNIALRETRNLLKLLLRRQIVMSLDLDHKALQQLQADLRLYKDNPVGLEHHIFGYGAFSVDNKVKSIAVKNMIHMRIRKVMADPKILWGDRTINVFGDLKLAEAMMGSF